MPANSLQEKKAFRANAMLIGERIDLRTLENLDKLASAPYTAGLRNGGIAVLFRYGAIVFFDSSSIEQADFLAMLQPMIVKPFTNPEKENVEISINSEGREGMEGNTVFLENACIERLQLVAEILGKSVALAQYESNLRDIFDRIEPIAANLEYKSRIGRHGKDVLRHIGSVLLSEHRMVGRIQVTEKPELIWNRPELERLFLRLEDEFEIKDRHEALERKLHLITRTAETVHNLLQEGRSLRVEWYIVILIVMEIFLTLYELFIIGH
ncbi:MAG: RMD1 family protein [Candidatus Omnitrophica bacterium]|nr:RMD1 family protein [Candidatus Omnitrophota bacterium]